MSGIGLLLISLIAYLIWHHRENKKSKEKIELLLKAYTSDIVNQEKYEVLLPLIKTTTAKDNRKMANNISIDEEKENRVHR